MGSLSNLYISQSYQSLIHLGTNNTASANLIELQDGLGNSIGVAVNTNGDLFLSGSLTASLQQGYLYVGNASGKTTAFATSSLVTTVNTGSLVTTASFNAFTQSINSATQSLFTSASLGLTTASFSGNTLTFTKGNGTTFGIVIPDVSGSTIDTGSFATTSSFNSYTQSTNIRLNNLESTSASVNVSITNLNSTTSSFATSIANLNSNSASVNTSITNLNASSASQQVSIDALNTFTASQSTASIVTSINNLNTFSASALISINALNVASASLQSFTSSQYVSNSYFATTGSNTFRGNETFEDAGGNASTLVPTSGSLMLVAKTFTSASAHLSASANTFVNLIFKNNSTNGDTIISGSNNIFTNPGAVTAGFKRYIGGSQNYYGAILPQITGSAAFSPSMNNNILATGMLMRIPVSSSAYTMNGNVLMNPAANGIQLGTAAATNFEKAVSGLTFTNNVINGTVFATAYKTPLSASVGINSNVVAGAVTMNLDSASFSISQNSINGTFTVNNSYFPGTVTAASATLTAATNIIGGALTLYTSGSNTTFTGAPRSLQNSLSSGAGNVISASLNGDNSSVNSVGLLGQALLVYGNNSRPAALTAADWGSAYVGRWNAVNNNRAYTADTVFAVGTGRSEATRKTGFLIDSGSNSFFEGTLNVSGSSTFTGSLNGLTLTRGPGNNNVGIGVNILQNAVSGGNVALGTDALRDNTSGTDNVALGNSSLAANISGDRNMAIGSNTLDSNTTGTLNVAIGNATLAGLVDGSANIGIGFEALKNQTTGSNNVGIGSQVLNQNISGSGNIAFGAKAGYNETGSNNFYINNTEYGSINADRSGSLMWGKMDTTTTNQTLQINASTRITNNLTIQSGSSFFANGTKQFNVGAFQSNITQSGSANVSQSMNFEVTDISQGVSIASNSRITLANSGTYNIQFSAQTVANSGADNLYIWLKKNGTNVTASAGNVEIANNQEVIAAWNYVVDAVAGDYFELAWQAGNAGTILLAANASGNIPSIPSIILTVTQVR